MRKAGETRVVVNQPGGADLGVVLESASGALDHDAGVARPIRENVLEGIDVAVRGESRGEEKGQQVESAEPPERASLERTVPPDEFARLAAGRQTPESVSRPARTLQALQGLVKHRHRRQAGQGPRWRRHTAPGKKRKSPETSSELSKTFPGDVLLSHEVYLEVPSGLKGLTAVFGMGTGVAP